MKKSVSAEKQTVKTDQTDNIGIKTNNEFLKAIFSDIPENVRPIVVSIAGNPNRAPKSSWYGISWTPKTQGIHLNCNNYFTLSCYRRDESEKYRRQKKNFHTLHSIMLDDIGTKVNPELITLPPSWMIETSKGNYQAGYILKTPIEDAVFTSILVNAIIQAGLCDKGADGPTARLARLPFGVNGKHKPVFSCKLKSWKPDLKYTAEEIIAAYALDIESAKKGKKSNDFRPNLFIPNTSKNPVIDALKSKNLYKAPLGEGKHDITCPWHSEHSGAVDGGTGYFEPSDYAPVGGFNCFHTHCKDRNHINFLLEYLSIERKDASIRPTIYCTVGEMYLVADDAQKALVYSKKYYQRGAMIVSVVKDYGTKETSIKNITQPALTLALSQIADWLRYDTSWQTWVRSDPPKRIVSVLHDATDYKHLPFLNSLAYQPYLRPDASLVTEFGYDIPTATFCIFDGHKFTIPPKPTKEDAEQALSLIKEILTEFSFANEFDLSATVSAILTAVIRPSLSYAPMYHVRAGQIGSGKSYLCKVISAFASPYRSSPVGFPNKDEEFEKLLFSKLVDFPAVIEFDNLTRDIPAHGNLCSALTEEFVSGRILGFTKTISVSTKVLILSSGNNVGPTKDMVRRCSTINLDPICEHPAMREFKNPNLLNLVMSEREKYVSAALTIIMAWIEAGCPKQECKNINGFEGWSDYCRQPLLWLSMPDPAQSMFDVMEDNPESNFLAQFLTACYENFEDKPFKVRDIINAPVTFGNESLHEITEDIASEKGEINRNRLGYYIKINSNKVVNGLRFVPVRGKQNVAVWRVEKIKSV